MKKKIEYLRLQIVSSFTWIPRIILISMMFAIIIGAAAYGIASYKDKSSDSNLLNVAVVFDEEDTSKYIRQAISLISNEETVASVCTFKEMNYDTAITALKDGTIDAALVIPKGLIKSIMNGENKTIEIICPSVGVNNSSYIYQEMLSAGASIVSTAEAGIYSMDDVLNTLFAGESSKQTELENKLSEIYFDYALDRTLYFKVTDISSVGGLSTIQFYICAGFMLLLIFSGIICEKLFTVDNNSLTKVLRIVGIKEGYISFARVTAICIVYTCIGWIIQIFISLAGLRYSKVYSLFEVGSVTGLIKSMLGLLVLNFAILSFIYFIFILINNTIYKVIGLFIVGITCMYMSGCIIASSLLPNVVRKIGECLPTYYYFKLTGQALTTKVTLPCVIINISISVILLIIATLVLKIQVRKE